MPMRWATARTNGTRSKDAPIEIRMQIAISMIETGLDKLKD